MANIIVKLKNKTKQFVYDEIENDIVISNITIIDEDKVNMDIQYEKNTIAKTYSFVLNDYFGTPVLNNITDDVAYESYIQEVFEELAEMHNFWKN